MILITHLECTGIIVIVDGKKIHTCHKFKKIIYILKYTFSIF